MPEFDWERRRASLDADAWIAGVDEVGRGPLVGDVVAAAVILPREGIAGLRDSKAMSPRQREKIAVTLLQGAVNIGLGRASPEEIDHLNILHATMLAMQRAVAALTVPPALVLVDGNRLPDWDYPSFAVVKGDARVPEIAAASIVAKVTRDGEMAALDKRYPGYGFAAHKGYPTRQHLEALAELGPTPQHRRSFRPVRNAIANTESHEQRY